MKQLVVLFNRIRSKTRLIASDIDRRIIFRIPVTDILAKIPGVASRLKIFSSTKVSIIVACGNRLEHLKVSLPIFLNQDWNNYDVILSIYADQEGAEKYVRTHFSDQLQSGKLKLVITEAEIFNKARALNTAVLHACKPNGQLFVVSSVELEGPGNMLSS